MIKLQFINTTLNLLTKFHMEKIDTFLLFNFLTWYKVITYIGKASTLISDVFNLITWLYLIMVPGPYITF